MSETTREMGSKTIAKRSALADSALNGLQLNKALDYSLPLLLLATRLSKTKSLNEDSITRIKAFFTDEIIALSSKLGSLNIYTEKDLIKFKYCLCVFIDEMLLRNEIFIGSHWANHTLAIRMFDEALGGDKFYDIVRQWLLSADKHKDMLEFIYACLVLGYKGKYSLDSQGEDKIEYLCSDIASAIAPIIGSNEDVAFELAYQNMPENRFLRKLGHRHFKKAFIFIAIIATIATFCYCLITIQTHNEIIKNDIASSIESFTQDMGENPANGFRR